MSALAADLDRFGARLPVAARPATLGYRAKKFVRRHRWGVAAAAVVGLALVGSLLDPLEAADLSVRGTSVAVGADGLGLIAYCDWSRQTLKVAHCADSACSTATIATVAPACEDSASIAIGTDGLGLISHHYLYTPFKRLIVTHLGIGVP